MRCLVAMSAIAGLVAAATTAFAEGNGLSLEMGRLSYSGHYLTQVVMVKNAGTKAYAGIRVECGFFRASELVAADYGYIENLAADSTGFKEIHAASDVAADRGQCRIVEAR